MREINARIVMSIYANSVFTRTSFYMKPLFIKKVFFSVSMKIFIISERSNCMNKASSATGSYLQNFFFFSKSIYEGRSESSRQSAIKSHCFYRLQ